jgi:hypothetical protein
MPKPRTVLAALALGALSGCYSTNVAPEATNWFLVEVRYDPALAGNVGDLPTFRRPAGTNFAGAPAATGFLKVGDTGKAVCVVRFDEPVVGHSGRISAQRYEIVNFSGSRTEEDDERFVSRIGGGGDARLGVATELRIERSTPTRLLVSPSTRDKALPYRYVFASDVSAERPVEIPFVDG